MTLILRSQTSSPRRRTAVWAAIAATVSLSLPQPLVAQPQRSATLTVTARADAGALQALNDAFFTFENAANAAKGKSTADSRRQLDAFSGQLQRGRAAIRAFLAQLRDKNEVQAFEQMVYAAAAKTGRSTLAEEIRKDGGPVAILGRADTFLDALLDERRKAIAPAGLDDFLEALGLTVSLEAGIRTTACGAFWFTLTLGYGTNLAYRSCYY